MRKILTCLLLMLLAGCSTSRKLTTQSEQTATDKSVADTRTESVSHQEKRTATVTRTRIAETGDVEIVRKEYDTTQATDTLTGTPPLKAETVIRRRSEKEIRQEQATTSQTAGTDSAVIADHKHHDATAVTDTRIKQKQNRQPFWMIWVVLGIVVVLIFKIRIR